jgi:site-specific DNA recombinase
VSTVYFTKVDCIGRNARDSLNIVHELRRCGVRMIVLDPRLDTSDTFGYFLFVILAAAAELESMQIMERTMGGRMEMLDQTSAARLPAKRGGRKARYGLRYVPAREPGERDRWERHPEEARWVLYIHTHMAAEHSAESVARDLNRRGVAGPEGGVWYAATARKIVHADCYCGTMTRRRGGQEFTFPVEEIVPEELRQRARAQLARNKERSPRNTKYEYLLAGTRSEPLLVCRTPGCDCRRVMLSVIGSRQQDVLARISPPDAGSSGEGQHH